MSDPTEIFDLYAADDYRVIGRATRGECHTDKSLIHAVTRIHVWDPQGRLLLQLRSASKDIQPGKWDMAVGGHLLPGEAAEAAARREMREELGVEARPLVFLHRFLMRSPNLPRRRQRSHRPRSSSAARLCQNQVRRQ